MAPPSASGEVQDVATDGNERAASVERHHYQIVPEGGILEAGLPCKPARCRPLTLALGVPEGVGRRPIRAARPGFDLHQDHLPALLAEQIDLPTGRTQVAGVDPVTAPPQVAGCHPLTAPTDLPGPI